MQNSIYFKKALLFTLLLCLPFVSFSQEETQNDDTDHSVNGSHNIEHSDKHYKKHDVTFIIGHTHVGSGLNSAGDKKWLVLPSFGLNYNYHFNKKWALGLHNHMIIEEFLVTGDDSNNSLAKSSDADIVGVERGRPISVTLIASYKIHKHISFIAGGGMEFSSHENFKVIKFGVEFPFHIPNNWEVIGVFEYDINIDAYQSFTVGMGIAKLF